MDIEIKKEVENKPLGRKELFAMVSYKGKTPSKSEVKEEICRMKNLNPDTTIIVKVEQLYGQRASSVIIHSYDSKEAMNVEHDYLIKRFGKKREEPPKAEEAAGAPGAAVPGSKEGDEGAKGNRDDGVVNEEGEEKSA
ncbi:MAG: hypothetical protein QW393_00040 [Candidatus Micrarchaeaceae archaeon]